jgi:hypothetical protein
MTDEQWVWLFINESIDKDEQFEGMCDECKREVTSVRRCNRCGKVLANSDEDKFVNPNFDSSKFDKLSNGEDDEVLTQIEGDDDIGVQQENTD